MISRKGRYAPQRYSRMLFFAALRGLGEHIFSLAKNAMRRKEKHPFLLFLRFHEHHRPRADFFAA